MNKNKFSKAETIPTTEENDDVNEDEERDETIKINNF